MDSFSTFTREQIALEQRQAALQVVTRPSATQEHAQILQTLLGEEPTAHDPLLSCFVLLQIGFIPISLGNLDQFTEALTHPKLLLFLKTPHDQLQLDERREMIPICDRDPMPVESLLETLENKLNLPSCSIQLHHFLIRPRLQWQRCDQ